MNLRLSKEEKEEIDYHFPFTKRKFIDNNTVNEATQKIFLKRPQDFDTPSKLEK